MVCTEYNKHADKVQQESLFHIACWWSMVKRQASQAVVSTVTGEADLNQWWWSRKSVLKAASHSASDTYTHKRNAHWNLKGNNVEYISVILGT